MPTAFSQMPTPYQGGSVLRIDDGQFAIYKPTATENMITNPSFERDANGYTDVNSAITRVITESYFGSYSLKINGVIGMDARVYYAMDLEDTKTYTFTLYIKGYGGTSYTIGFYTPLNVSRSIHSFVATGQWERVRVTYTADSTNTYRLTIKETNLSASDSYYIDGVQCEELPYPTSYCDGDRIGFTQGGYYWLGVPHQSRSVRDGDERHGGREIFLQNLGLIVQGYQGLSYQPIANEITQNLFIAGSSYLGSISNERRITLSMRTVSQTLTEVQRIKKSLIELMDYSQTSEAQPFMLRYHQTDRCGRVTGEPAQIPCVYVSGLEGITTNDIGELFDIQLIAPNPFLEIEREQALDIALYEELDDINYCLRRINIGGMAKMDDGFDAEAFAVIQNLEGNMVYGGQFTSADAKAFTRGIAVWNTTTDEFEPLGSGGAVGTKVYCLAMDFQGRLYAGGDFLNMGGVASADYVAMWDGSAWNGLGGGGGGEVKAIVIDRFNNVYIGGTSNNMGGVGGKYIAKWDGAFWTTVGSSNGFDAGCYALVLGADGETVYAGGLFQNTNGGGTTLNGCAVLYPNATDWLPMGLGFTDGSVSSGILHMKRLPSGDLIAIGNDTTPPSISMQVYRGGQDRWEPVLVTFDGTFAFGSALYVDPDGLTYIGGSFSNLNGLTSAIGWFTWNGTTIIPGDIIDLDINATPNAFAKDRKGNLFFALNGALPTVVGAQTTGRTVVSDVAVYPLIEVWGPSVTTEFADLYQIGVNGGGAIRFKPYRLLPNERIRILCQPGDISVTSSIRGNIISEVIAGSEFSRILLQPGPRIIHAFLDFSGFTGAGVAINMYYHETKASL